MRKRVLRSLALLSLLGTTIDAQGSDKSDWYLTLGAGGLFATDADGTPVGSISFDGGYTAGVGIGYHAWKGDGVSLDLHGEVMLNNYEISDDDVSNNSLSSDKVETVAWMISAIGRGHFTPQFSYYLGVGVGWAASIELNAFDQPGNFTLQDDSAFAYQGKFGVTYGLGGNTDVSIGYRYFTVETIDITDLSNQTFELDYDRHIAEVVMSWGL